MFLLFLLVTVVSSELFLIGFQTSPDLEDDRDIYMFDTVRNTLKPWRKSQSPMAKLAMKNTTHVFYVNVAYDRVELVDLSTNLSTLVKTNLSCASCNSGSLYDGTCLCNNAFKLKSNDQPYVISKTGSTYAIDTVDGINLNTFTSNAFQDCQFIHSNLTNKTWVLYILPVGISRQNNVFVKELSPNTTVDSTMVGLTQPLNNVEIGVYSNSFYWVIPNSTFWIIYSYTPENSQRIFLTNLTFYNPVINFYHTPNNTRCTFIQIDNVQTIYMIISFVYNFRNNVRIIKLTILNNAMERTNGFPWNSTLTVDDLQIEFFSNPWEQNYLFLNDNTIVTLAKYSLVEKQSSSHTILSSVVMILFMFCVWMYH